MGNNSKAKEFLHNLDATDEETLRLAARSAYDQNPDLMTPQELLLFVLFGYTEEPPKNDDMPDMPSNVDFECNMKEPI